MAEKTIKETPLVRQESWLSGLQRDFETAHKQTELLGGQLVVQDLFVDTLKLVARVPGATARYEGVIGVYNGNQAVLEISQPLVGNTDDSRGSNIEDSARYMVFEVSEDGDGRMLCDVVIDRARTDPLWKAEKGEYHGTASRRGGNPGITWHRASGLVEGANSQPFGLAPEVQHIRAMVKGVLAASA